MATITTAPLNYRYTKGQQSLIEAVLAQGWKIDPRRSLNNYVGGWGKPHWTELPADEQVKHLTQHPFVFTRPAVDGGSWQLELDYEDRSYSGYSSNPFGKTLQAAKLRYFDASGAEQPIRWFGTSEYAYGGDGNYPGRPNHNIGAAWLKNPGTSRWRSTNWLWEATRDQDGGYTLRSQVLKLATSPETVIWIAAELKRADHLRAEAAREAKKADQQARARQLAPSWDKLRYAARDIVNADGKSDPVALLTALKAAVAAVEEEVVVR